MFIQRLTPPHQNVPMYFTRSGFYEGDETQSRSVNAAINPVKHAATAHP